MPEMKLNEHVSHVVHWRIISLFKVGTVLLDTLQEKQQLVRLDASAIFT